MTANNVGKQIESMDVFVIELKRSVKTNTVIVLFCQAEHLSRCDADIIF